MQHQHTDADAWAVIQIFEKVGQGTHDTLLKEHFPAKPSLIDARKRIKWAKANTDPLDARKLENPR